MAGLDTPSGRKRDRSEVSPVLEMFSKLPKQEEDQELEDELAQLKLGKTAPDWAQELFDHVKTMTRISHNRLYSKVSCVVSQCATNTIIISQLEETNSHLQARVEHAEKKIGKLNEVLLHQEVERRRMNLLLHGVDEAAWETREQVETSVQHFLSNTLKLDNVPVLHKIHRIGPKGSKHRPIMMSFKSLEDRNRVWKAKNYIQSTPRVTQEHGKDVNEPTQKTKVFLTQDYPTEVRARRRRLVPIFKKAKSLEEYKDVTYLHDDKLIIQGNTYTVSNIDTITDRLHPVKLSTCTEGDTLFFWSVNSPLSNHHPSMFVVGDTCYNCVEQYYMHQMAVVCKDMNRAQAILDSDDPAVQKQIAKPLRPKDWNNRGKEIMMTGLRAKFTQNKTLCDFLVRTNSLVIAEASPYDTYWGIGLSLGDDKKTDHTRWRGDNKLGKLLEVVREELTKKGQ
jgi:ribA/ribD-fused uncharacterized protein